MSTLAILWLIVLTSLKIATWLIPALLLAVAGIRYVNAREAARSGR